jgi:hypothetical protein
MILKISSFALATLIALVSGCATSPPPSKNPSAQVQWRPITRLKL